MSFAAGPPIIAKPTKLPGEVYATVKNMLPIKNLQCLGNEPGPPVW